MKIGMKNHYLGVKLNYFGICREEMLNFRNKNQHHPSIILEYFYAGRF